MNDKAENVVRVAIVTGASRGIGREIAKRLAADGRHVVLASRSAGPLEELRVEIESAGGQASVQTVDMSDGAAVASMVEAVVKEHGRLDILVNNAGITRDNLSLRMTDEEFDDVINVNLRGVFIACRAAARPMMRGRFGRMVNIGSTSGLVGNPGQANYAAAKSGLCGMTKSFARELGSKGITANVVALDFIQTEMTANLGDAVLEKVKGSVVVGRLGIPEDIASAVSFISSDEAGYVTGQVLAVDGGLTMC